MSADLFANQDGANFKAQAVLALVRSYTYDILDVSWSYQFQRRMAEPKVARWSNGREQGYIVYMVGQDDQQINIAFYEHRASDDLCAIVFETTKMRNPITIDTLPEGVFTHDANYNKIVGPNNCEGLARYIADELAVFWTLHELPKSAAEIAAEEAFNAERDRDQEKTLDDLFA